jgi:hypothetical protein
MSTVYVKIILRTCLAQTSQFSELTLQPSSLAQSDHFIGMDGAVEQSLAALPGVTAFGAAQVREYRNQKRFDTVQFIGGLAWRDTLSVIQPDLQAHLSYLSMGGRTYESGLNLQGGFWYAAQNLAGMPLRWGSDLQIATQHYPDNPVYDSRHAELRLKAQLQINADTALHMQTGLVRDMAIKGRPGGDRRGSLVSVSVEVGLTDKQRLVINLQRQTLAEANPYSPVFFGPTLRQPRTTQFSARYL